MLTINAGTLAIRKGRLNAEIIAIRFGGKVHNDSEVFSTTTASDGEIAGTGTWWAWWKTSEYIGGTIDAAQTVVYYGDRPVERRYFQLQFGSLIVGVPSGSGSVLG